MVMRVLQAEEQHMQTQKVLNYMVYLRLTEIVSQCEILEHRMHGGVMRCEARRAGIKL